MKKLAIGCGILLVVLLVGGAVASYVIYNKVKSTVAEFAALGEIPAIERGVRNSATFTPPESGELTEAQVARYVKVQGQVRTLLGSRFDEFKTKYAELSKRMDNDQGNVLDVARRHRRVQATWRSTYVDAKKAQVEALNRRDFSLERVPLGAPAGVRCRRHAGDGLRRLEGHRRRDIGQVAPAAAGPEAGRARIEPTGPEVNKTLVAPHKKLLEDNAALTFFGL